MDMIGPGTKDVSRIRDTCYPFPPASHLDREEWPHSTGSSPGDAWYKWPCCVPPSGSRHCSQSGRSLQAGCWSGPGGSRGVEPWAGCSRALNKKRRSGDHAQMGRQTDMLLPTRHPHSSPISLSSPWPSPLLSEWS